MNLADPSAEPLVNQFTSQGRRRRRKFPHSHRNNTMYPPSALSLAHSNAFGPRFLNSERFELSEMDPWYFKKKLPHAALGGIYALCEGDSEFLSCWGRGETPLMIVGALGEIRLKHVLISANVAITMRIRAAESAASACVRSLHATPQYAVACLSRQ